MGQGVVKLNVGMVQALTANENYAMPGKICTGYISTTTGLEANIVAGTTTGWTVVTITANEFMCSAPFIRSTTTASVRLTSY